MKTTIRYSQGRLRYTGRVERGWFGSWAGSTAGQSVVERVASEIPFALLGRRHAARRRVWRQLAAAASTEVAKVAVEREIQLFLSRLDGVVGAHDLPHVHVNFHSLIVVPRMFVNAEALRRLATVLESHSAFAALDGGESLRSAFTLALIDAIGDAVDSARPSPRRPLAAGGGWSAVGVNQSFEWRTTHRGPEWPGHYYVLEVKPEAMTPALQKSTAAAIARLEAALPRLSPAHRTEILKQAWLSLERPRAWA